MHCKFSNLQQINYLYKYNYVKIDIFLWNILHYLPFQYRASINLVELYHSMLAIFQQFITNNSFLMDHAPTNEVVLLSSQLNTLQQYINHYHKYLDHDTIFVPVFFQVFQLKLTQLFLNLYFIL